MHYVPRLGKFGAALSLMVRLQGAVPMGERVWERARILAGRPAADSELTELYNPLEAGLYSAVSISKVSEAVFLHASRLTQCVVILMSRRCDVQGCYIGAETLAKVVNLEAVKQQLWGLQLSGLACIGDTIQGDYTSCHHHTTLVPLLESTVSDLQCA